MQAYSNFLKQTVYSLVEGRLENPLFGLKICVNPGNGAGGFLAETLKELGADTSPSIHLDPDGEFPNHIPNPEDKVAISTTANQVLRTGSDLGICLDTDADRVGIVDGDGRLLNRNGLIALASRIALRGAFTASAPEGRAGVVVTDSATSNELSDYITRTLGGRHVRYKKGYRHVIELARATPGSVLAIECSGHGAWRDNGWVDDGCYTAVRALCELVSIRSRAVGGEEQPYLRPPLLSDLIRDLREPAESVEVRMKMVLQPADDRAALVAAAMQRFADIVASSEGWRMEPVNHDGLRAQFLIEGKGQLEGPGSAQSGWCMLRTSLHEPVFSLHIECALAGGLQYAARTLLHGGSGQGGLSTFSSRLDLSALERLAGCS
eukprot:gene2669-3235_t